jgi:Cu/Ag efflux protein CusF
MDKKGIVTAFLLAAGLLGTPNVQAQRTYEEMEQLTVNEQVTTVITASEPVRFVDISTDKVVGDQPIDNIVRLKPKEGGHEDGEVLAIVTIVTERYRTQYALLYTTRVREAVTDKEIQLQERNAYHNPAVSMSTVEMTRFARRIWNSPAKIRNVVVVKKMTFPNDKILTVEMTEKQISGRNISLNIDYEDVLSADSFSTALLEEE